MDDPPKTYAEFEARYGGRGRGQLTSEDWCELSRRDMVTVNELRAHFGLPRLPDGDVVLSAWQKLHPELFQ